jgi:GntR family transcriptional regulator
MARRSEGGEAAYQVLARELRTSILQERYPSGVRLPTEAELVKQYQVSRQTVRRAFHELVSEGMVLRTPGRGTFAAPRDGQYLRQFGSIDDLMGLSIDTSLELLTPLRRKVDVGAASRLRLETDVVYTLTFLRLHDGAPFCHTSVYLPPEVGRKLDSVPELTKPCATSSVTVIGLLDKRLEHPIAEAEQSITVASAPPEVATQLECAEDHPLLRIDRVYSNTQGEPVELAVSHFHPEQYSYRVRLRRSIR